MSKNISINVSKSLRSKWSQKPLDQEKQSATKALKTFTKREIQKRAEATPIAKLNLKLLC